MGDLEDSGVEGMDLGSFIVNGQQTQRFLVTSDDTQLYMLAADPVDVSLTSEELAAEIAEREAAAALEAEERSAALAQAVAGLPVRGNPDAPVTIIEFSDFECPYCARGYRTMEQVLEKYPEDVKFIYAHFPLGNHPWAKPSAIASVCVAQQDPAVFWDLHDHYFENQSQFNETNVIDKSRTFLADSGIDLDTWAACASDASSEASQGASAVVDGLTSLGSQHGVTGTPGFFINGYFFSGAQPLETFDQVIEQAKQDVE
jgi:protein-disulfide isomerase